MSHNSHHAKNNNKNNSKDELSERSYVAAAHRDDRSEEDRQESLDKAKEIHLARTGSELDEDLEKKEKLDNRAAQPGLASSEEGRKERAYIAAAHREGRDEDAKKESLEKASALHEERTGEPLSEEEEEEDDEVEEEEEENNSKSSKNSKKKSKVADKSDDRVAQPGLAATAEGRQERAHIAAAHRKDRDEEGKKESLEKASELHEKRTGEPLPEAEESSNESHKDKKQKKASNIEKESKASKSKDSEKKSKASPKKDTEDKTETHHKRHHEDESRDNDKKASPKRQKTDDTEEEKPVIAGHVIEQPGLAGSHDGRRERAFIASAHNKTHSEESQLESLEKANELHEKRTGEPLQEAVERGVAAQ